MPVVISDADYKEYRALQNNVLSQRRFNSVRGMKSLKNDIDVPIRNLVAMFALLGCEPLWSCCGFDYDGQPIHKTHEYGDVFIVFHNTKRSRDIINRLKEEEWVIDKQGNTDKWETWIVADNLYLRSDFDYYHQEWKYPWSTRNCIHYPELAILKIDNMERTLFYCFQNEFMDEVILSDTNKSHKKRFHNWQYPTLEDWVIRKREIFDKNKEEENG